MAVRIGGAGTKLQPKVACSDRVVMEILAG
jgi:hypothetical protein